MRRFTTLAPSLAATLLACGLTFSGCATTGPQLAQSWDGLELKPTKGIDAVYVRPAADLSRYRTVLIDPVAVSFKDSWSSNRGERGTGGSLTVADVSEVRASMAAGFRKIFAEELAGGGYAVTEAPSLEALRLTAALADVYVSAPARETFGPARTFTVEPNEMTLVLELRDSVSNELLARVVDRKTGVDTGRLKLTTSETNRAEFERAVKSWAKRLRAGLDAVNGKAP